MRGEEPNVLLSGRSRMSKEVQEDMLKQADELEEKKESQKAAFDFARRY